MFSKNLVRWLLLLAVVCALSVSVAAQGKEERGLNCDNNRNSDHGSHCQIKEQTIAATGGVINVDGRTNGGVAAKGWERNEILVRAQIQTWAETDAEAQELAKEVRVVVNGTNIHSDGPRTQGRRGWSVSFEVFVPRRSDLSLKAHNGGISISDVSGRMDFSTTNGGVTLKRLAGHVQGSTTNGGLNIELSGERWEGEGLDVKTTNGGVRVSVPENYSAYLEAHTVNGGLNFDFPVTVQGKIERDLKVNLGGGGAPLRLSTVNGGVALKRKS